MKGILYWVWSIAGLFFILMADIHYRFLPQEWLYNFSFFCTTLTVMFICFLSSRFFLLSRYENSRDYEKAEKQAVIRPGILPWAWCLSITFLGLMAIANYPILSETLFRICYWGCGAINLIFVFLLLIRYFSVKESTDYGIL